jgi:hypothetical protein
MDDCQPSLPGGIRKVGVAVDRATEDVTICRQPAGLLGDGEKVLRWYCRLLSEEIAGLRETGIRQVTSSVPFPFQ